MARKRKQYSSEFKFKVVMESFQKDTTIEAVCRKFDVPSSVVSRGLREFQHNGPGVFEGRSKEQKQVMCLESRQKNSKRSLAS